MDDRCDFHFSFSFTKVRRYKIAYTLCAKEKNSLLLDWRHNSHPFENLRAKKKKLFIYKSSISARSQSVYIAVKWHALIYAQVCTRSRDSVCLEQIFAAREAYRYTRYALSLSLSLSSSFEKRRSDNSAYTLWRKRSSNEMEREKERREKSGGDKSR